MDKIIEYLERKERPSLSNLIYLICGIIGFLCLAYLIVPFEIDVKDFSLTSSFSMVSRISDKSMVARIPFWVLLLYFITIVARNVVLNSYQEIDKRYGRAAAIMYSIENIFDLISALFVFVFVISVCIQFLKTRVFFISVKSCLIYAVIVYRFVAFLFYRFWHRNKEIIDKALQ